MKVCEKCGCAAVTTRDGYPVCWHHADPGLDEATCAGCDGPAYMDLADLENEWPENEADISDFTAGESK